MTARISMSLLAANLAALGASGCSSPEGGCKTDLDCKGDRVCVAGSCTEPTGAARTATSGAPGPASGAPAASASPAASSATPVATHKCPDGMVAIPGGTFEMGSARPYPKSGKEVGLSERDSYGWAPKHKVTLSPYCIDKFEVSVRRFKRCVDDKKCAAPGLASGAGNSNWGVAGRENDPITLVGYEQARDFCRVVDGGRLPTEAEWEYAARGADGREYPWGSEPEGKTIACEDSLVSPRGRKLIAAFGEGSRCGGGVHGTWPVGSAPAGASPFGLLDVAGNVMEWVEDLYDVGFYAKSPGTDPRNPPTKIQSQTGVVRGGGWSHGGGEADVTPGWSSRTYWREPMPYYIDGAAARDAEIGFRCAANAGG